MRAQAGHADLVRACFYDDPLLSAAERYWSSSEWQAMRELLPQTRGSALDLGAGRGIASFALARDGWKTTALEPDPSAIVGAGAIQALAAESGLAIEVVQERGERLPFASGSFDLVFGRAVMHHAQDLLSFCKEASRVLAPGGTFIGAREHVISSPGQRRAFLAAHPLHRHYGGEQAFPLSNYLGALRSAGLKPRRVLNPLASDVNLFPDTRESLRRSLASSLRLPFPGLLRGWMLDLLGAVKRDPGRLYTFVAMKPHA